MKQHKCTNYINSISSLVDNKKIFPQILTCLETDVDEDSIVISAVPPVVFVNTLSALLTKSLIPSIFGVVIPFQPPIYPVSALVASNKPR